MSYEGYQQVLCENGHYATLPCEENAEKHFCSAVFHGSVCGAKFVFVNVVDDTNDDSYGVLPPAVWDGLLVEEKKVSLCSCCGHSRATDAEIFRIPSPEEHANLRYRLVDCGSPAGDVFAKLDD